MISVLILTKNEEENLRACLASVKWCDDVVVLDCGSTDGTVEVGVRVEVRPFDDWSTHLNWALENLHFAHPWVYNCDADEIVPDDLRGELLAVAAVGGSGNVAFRLRYRNYFQGRWIRHCGIYPTWVLRFFRPERVRWERLVNSVPAVDGRVGRLQSHFEHRSFGKGLDAWFAKHNRYSTLEALETIRHRQRKTLDVGGLAAVDDPVRRRRALKELSFRLPCRPALRFFYMYLLRGGFLDGAPGWTYCRLLAAYERMIVWKVRELERRERGLSP